MKILAIDQSLNDSGYCVFTDGVLTKSGNIRIKNEKGVERLVLIRNYIKNLLITERPDVVAIEDYSYSSFGRAVFNLGELGGILRLLFRDMNQRFFVIPIQSWKKAITGHGNTKKDSIMLYVYKHYNVEFNNDNIADAYCMGVFVEMYLKYLECDRNFKDYQLEVLKKFNKEDGEDNE